MDDSLLDDCLVTCIELDNFFKLNEENIVGTFMSLRRSRQDKSNNSIVSIFYAYFFEVNFYAYFR
jgi:hypothetical protein